MRSPLGRVRRGAGFLAFVLIGAVLGYRWLGYGWIESVWMVVITVASVGYGERSQESSAVQLLTIGVIIFGISAAFYTFGGFIEMVLEGELEQVLGHRRRTRDIEKLNNHVVICGFGRIGQILASDLSREKTPFVVIDQDTTRIGDALSRDYLFLEGDATSDEVLQTAGVARARVLVTALPNDAANVFITLTGRNLNPKIYIVARAEHRSSEKKLLQAGANKVVLPASTGAKQMARWITRPTTADLVELVTETGRLDVELDELPITEGTRLVGLRVRESEAHKRFGLLIIAVKRTDGEMVFNPDADHQIGEGEILIVMGRRSDIVRFRAEFRV